MYTHLREKIYLKSGGTIPKYNGGAAIVRWKERHPEDAMLPDNMIIQKIKLQQSSSDFGDDIDDTPAYKKSTLIPMSDQFQNLVNADQNEVNQQSSVPGISGKIEIPDISSTVDNNIAQLQGPETIQRPKQAGTYMGQVSGNHIWNGSEWILNDPGSNSNKAIIQQQAKDVVGQFGTQLAGTAAGYLGGEQGAQGFQGMTDGIKGMASGMKGGWAGALGGAMQMTSGIIDKQMLGDKNFSGTSQKIDGVVHGVSGAIAGIVPWGTLAAGIIESVNLATKAGGSTVQGYDVDINSSGYSQAMAHQESESSRGLFGIDFGNSEAKLRKRNENLKMAMKAAQIAEDNTFEQDARMNSVENTIMNNQIALSGGLNTSLLAG